MSGLRRLWPYLLLAVLALPAAWPFFHAGLPRTNDHLTHLYRVVQLDALVRAGVLLPRWAPDLVFGYGYPIFNFFPYLAHYLVEVLHLLGLDFLSAYRAACALVLLLSAWSAYAFGRELFGEAAGLVSGTAYLYSPYLLYDAHIRGSLPESLALALLPLALLHLRRAARGDGRSVAWAGVVLGACIFSHHGVSLQAMPFAAAYAAFEVIRDRRPADACVRGAAFVALAFGLGLLLSAFFWLPAMVESPAVQVERGTLNGGMLYTNNFLSLEELTASPRAPVDPDLLNPPVVRPLPLAALLLATLGLMQSLATPLLRPTRSAAVFFLLAALAAIGLIHPAARPVWDALPLLRLTLFPWRLLGPLSLFLAMGAGALLARPELEVSSGRPNPAPWLLAAALELLVAAGLPFASPPFEPVPERPRFVDMAAFELPPDFIGTTTVGEYLPRAVRQLPADVGARRDPTARPRFVADGAQVTETTLSPYRAEFLVTADRPVTFIYQQFSFPGWRASIDGQAASIRVTGPEGLMALDLAAGTHAVTFTFEDTWPRTLGNGLSVVGLLMVFGWLLFVRSGRLGVGSWGLDVWGWKLDVGFYFILFPFAFIVALARPLLHDAGFTPFLRRGLTPDGLRGVAHPVYQSFLDELSLLGWESPRPAIEADEALRVDLYWRANRRLGIPYGFDVKLVDAAGLIWSERETPRPRDWRFIPGTDFWPLDQYVVDPYLITPLAGAPPGEYWIRVEVFSQYNFQSIGAATLGPITITTPSRRPCLRQAQAILPNLELLDFSATEAGPGDDVIATLCWRGAPPSGRLWLLDHGGGNRLGAAYITGSVGAHVAWQPDDSAREQIAVRLPAALETGAYTWALALGDTATPIGQLQITAPERAFAAPAVARVLDADLGPATLHGVEAPAALEPGQPLAVTLVWRADELMDESYHVFVHLIGPDGGIAAQSDGAPAGWTRRTTGWLPGEFVTDARPLNVPANLPPGTYGLFAGLYRPADGVRLSPPAFPEGRVKLAEWTVP